MRNNDIDCTAFVRLRYISYNDLVTSTDTALNNILCFSNFRLVD